MKIFIVTLLACIYFAGTVQAEGQVFRHEVIVELDGEWTFNSSFRGPEVTSDVSLAGVGKAKITSITEQRKVPSWWELF